MPRKPPKEGVLIRCLNNKVAAQTSLWTFLIISLRLILAACIQDLNLSVTIQSSQLQVRVGKSRLSPSSLTPSSPGCSGTTPVILLQQRTETSILKKGKERPYNKYIFYFSSQLSIQICKHFYHWGRTHLTTCSMTWLRLQLHRTYCLFLFFPDDFFCLKLSLDDITGHGPFQQLECTCICSVNPSS